MGNKELKYISDFCVGYSNVHVKNFYEKLRNKIDEGHKRIGLILIVLDNAYLEQSHNNMGYDYFVSFKHECNDEQLELLLDYLGTITGEIVNGENIKFIKKSVKRKERI